MSKSITILEGGSTKQMTAEKLKIDLYSGGSSYWVPEDETRLTTKYITENGTYIAEDDGYYGYSEVTVNIQESSGVVTGLDPDGSGDWSAAWIDPTTGDIEIEKIPSRIEVTVPPSKTSYNDGETIDISGIVVKAYYETGNEWGVVPINELTITPTNASYDAGSSSSYATSDEIDISIPFAGSKQTVNEWSYHTEPEYRTTAKSTGATAYVCWFGDHYDLWTLSASAQAGALSNEQIKTVEIATGNVMEEKTSTIPLNQTYTHDNKTVYYFVGSALGAQNIVVELPMLATGIGGHSAGSIAWAVIYGSKVTGSLQTISVTWNRPRDGKALTTSFNISVHGEGTSSSEWGGSTDESGG